MVNIFIFLDDSELIKNKCSFDFSKSLSQEKQAELKKLFASYDVNNDGVITSEELKQAFAKLGQKVSDDDIIAMVGHI